MFRSIGWQELVICGCMLFPLVLGAVLVFFLVNRSTKSRTPAAGAAASAGWMQDPASRHQLRYWDGAQWTASVSDNGVQSTDPL